jgi:hypothetical protein
MKLVTLAEGDRLADTIQPITPTFAKLIKGAGLRGVIRYVTSIHPAELDAIFAEDLVLGFVTYANDLRATTHLAALGRLAIPAGCHVALDIEGASKHWPSVAAQIQDEHAWAHSIDAGDYIPMRYSGADQVLTSQEQWLLPYRLYWHSCSTVVDRNGAQSAPTGCGYSMFQDVHFNQQLAPGYVIDFNDVVGDSKGRFPVLVGG